MDDKDKLLSDLLEAAIWMTGSPDFNEGGQAHDGFQAVAKPAIAAALRYLHPEPEEATNG